MTSCYIQSHGESDGACTCGNCGWNGPASDLEMISDIQERIEAGEEVPAGECPDCGALAYLDRTALEESQTAERNTAARAMLAALEEAQEMLRTLAADVYEEFPARADNAEALADKARAAIAAAKAAGIEPA